MATMNFPEGGITVSPDVKGDISFFGEQWLRKSMAESGFRMGALLAGNWLDEPASPQFSAAEIHAHLDTTSAAEV